jgi:hypothetical protein
VPGNRRVSWAGKTGRAAWQPVALAGFFVTLCRKNNNLRAGVNFWFNGVCKVKNRLIGDFFDVLCAKRNKLL